MLTTQYDKEVKLSPYPKGEFRISNYDDGFVISRTISKGIQHLVIDNIDTEYFEILINHIDQLDLDYPVAMTTYKHSDIIRYRMQFIREFDTVLDRTDTYRSCGIMINSIEASEFVRLIRA